MIFMMLTYCLYPRVKVMTLTATATENTRRTVCRVLGMIQPSIVAVSPNRVNICYSVHKKNGTIEESFAPLVDELSQKRLCTPRTIVFCWSYEDVGYIYSNTTRSLGANAVDPVGAPDIARFRLVDMCTACTEKSVKDTIISNFTQRNARLRVLIATVAFGMVWIVQTLDASFIGEHEPTLRATSRKLAELEGMVSSLMQCSITHLKTFLEHVVPPA